jgi:hypothetical protein
MEFVISTTGGTSNNSFERTSFLGRQKQRTQPHLLLCVITPKVAALKDGGVIVVELESIVYADALM